MARKKKRRAAGAPPGAARDALLPCPCQGGLDYGECCQPYHDGSAIPEDVLTLTRARYSAYGMERVDYIMATTHPESEEREADRVAWERELMSFARQTLFRGLEIEQVQLEEEVAWVAFTVHLEQPEQEALVSERSRFEWLEDRWLYMGPED